MNPARLARGALDGLYLVCGVLAGLALVAIAVIMLLLSIGRQVGFNLRGGDEMAAWLTAATAFLGLAYTFRHGDLIRVTLLIERLDGRPRRVLETVVLLVASLFLGAFAWNAALRLFGLRPKPEFGHGAEAAVGDLVLLGCYHPSQQNTFTGVLKPEMLDAVLLRAKELAGEDSPEGADPVG